MTTTINLAVPAGPGRGAAQPAGLMARAKTVTVGGSFTGTITIEASAGLGFCQVATFTGPGEQEIDVICSAMRVLRSGTIGTPTVQIASDPDVTNAVIADVPATDGNGAVVDVSDLGAQMMVFVTGDTSFTGALYVEVGDGTNWVPAFPAFSKYGCFAMQMSATQIRVRRSGVKPGGGLPQVAVIGVTDSGDTADQINRIYPRNTQEIRYVRTTGGNDANDGLSPATAWATLNRGLSWYTGFAHNLSKVLDVTDCVFEVDETTIIPSVIGDPNESLDLTAPVGPNNFTSRNPGVIRAAMREVLPVTISGSVAAPTTQFRTFTVNEALVPNAHVGQFFIGTGLQQWGTIISNDATSLYVATRGTTFTAPGIYEPSAVFRQNLTSAFPAFQTSILGDTEFEGIRFEQPGLGTPICVDAKANGNRLTFHTCQIAGAALYGTSRQIALRCCYVTSFFSIQQANVFIEKCFFSGNFFAATGCVIDCFESAFYTPQNEVFGQSIPAQTYFANIALFMERCEIANAAGYGLILNSLRNNLTRVLIRDSVSDGIRMTQPSFALIATSAGTGNGGFGVLMQNGAQIDFNGTTLTGALGDISLGGAGATAYGAIPATDAAALNPQFCRIF